MSTRDLDIIIESFDEVGPILIEYAGNIDLKWFPEKAGSVVRFWNIIDQLQEYYPAMEKSIEQAGDYVQQKTGKPAELTKNDNFKLEIVTRRGSYPDESENTIISLGQDYEILYDGNSHTLTGEVFLNRSWGDGLPFVVRLYKSNRYSRNDILFSKCFSNKSIVNVSESPLKNQKTINRGLYDLVTIDPAEKFHPLHNL